MFIDTLLRQLLLNAEPNGILALLDLCCLLCTYGLLRLLGISVNRATWIIGGLLLLLCMITVALFLLPDQADMSFRRANILGAIAIAIALYAAGEWTARQGYRLLKKLSFAALARFSRGLFLFFRKHHQFFGWIAFATATIHGLILLLFFHHIAGEEIISGIVDWILQALLQATGHWIEYRIKKKRLKRNIRWLHVILTLCFFLVFIAHA